MFFFINNRGRFLFSSGWALDDHLGTGGSSMLPILCLKTEGIVSCRYTPPDAWLKVRFEVDGKGGYSRLVGSRNVSL